ncbi:cation:proton antiporter [Algoriphagus sp. NBT04N3]|nr:cation:proton antiporter [Algoriphagus sp. NBT04N3]
MMLLADLNLSLPITHPGMKFLIILVIILLAPLLLTRLKIPPLLGLIVAGAIVGPKGFGLMERDSGIILSGTAGLLYIMFLAGLEIDFQDFKSHSKKSLVFGMLTFLIPMGLGTWVGLYLLDLSMISSVLLASMFASHTLIAYPIISKLGITKNRAVTVAVGGTLITDTLALLILAVIVGMSKGQVDSIFWIKLMVSLLIFSAIVLWVMPRFAKWFLKFNEDAILQYVFILGLVFAGALMAEMAGLEGIIGAFMVGLALNPLIPRTSPLMNRVEFVGNAIFIPFFLIGVGMLVDFRVFFQDEETIKVAVVMTVTATLAKYLAALGTQKIFNYSANERRIIFGLSNAQAAATLAAVLIGYNLIIGIDDAGNAIRLLPESVLNGTIVMILITCTLASIEAQRGAKGIVISESDLSDQNVADLPERFLVPVRNEETAEELINLAINLKSPDSKSGIYALSIINPEQQDSNAEVKAQKTLNKASERAAATDHNLYELLRYDTDVSKGISSVVYENKATDLILGLHVQQPFDESFLGNLTQGLLNKVNTTTYIYRPFSPFSSQRRILVVIPPKAEQELGFPFWLIKIWNLAKNSHARMIFYVSEPSREYIEEILANNPIRIEFREFAGWEEPENLHIQLRKDDFVILILSRKGNHSYHPKMEDLPDLVNRWLKEKSFLLVYPNQPFSGSFPAMDFLHSTLPGPLDQMELISQAVNKIFKKGKNQKGNTPKSN